MLDTIQPHGHEVYHEYKGNANNETGSNPSESEWFSAFLRHTNQKILTSQVLERLINQYEIQAKIPDKVRILDIGCGEGELSERVVNSFTKVVIESYCGIDTNKEFLNQIHDKFLDRLFQTTLLKQDCFALDHQSLGRYNFILASNVLYYCQDIPAYFSSILTNLEDRGLLVFIHENSTSAPKAMRKKYKAKISEDIPNTLKLCSEAKSLNIEEFSVSSSITFNTDISLLLSSISTYQESLELLGNENILLLEFIVQTSLKTLEEKGTLISYLLDIKSVLLDNENKIPVISRIQLISRQ